MPVICPSITATNPQEYRQQIENIAKVAQRIQIDLTDGKFAAPQSVQPKDAWWPVGFKADFHLMYEQPLPAAKTIFEHTPNMIIVHSEAKGSFADVAGLCRQKGVKIGVALLPNTSVNSILPAINEIEHVLIFSGHLGHYGGHANLALLAKVAQLKEVRPELVVGWDGGVTAQNISQLIMGGVDVLNVGGFIQEAEEPGRAFSQLQRIADETGTT